MSALSQLIPVVRRARGYHLYSVSGRRYLDLWQNGGTSLLGHRPGRLTTALKNTISKGLVADLPTVFTGRLQRMLRVMFPDYVDFRFVSCPSEGLQLASAYLGRSIAEEDVIDPLIDQPKECEVSRWRPFVQDQPRAQVLLPIFPFGMAAGPVVICFRREPPADVPPQWPLSGVLLAGMLRCLHELKHRTSPEWFRPDLLSLCPGWKQKGLYVLPQFDTGIYPRVFERFLEQDVLLSPFPPFVSILPGAEISQGELRKMVGLFRTFPGK